MSLSPLPPPLPQLPPLPPLPPVAQLAPLAPVVPLAPVLPVAPNPAAGPVPVQALQYLSYAPVRPKLLSVVAVMSIVVGVLNSMAGIGLMGSAASFMNMSKLPIPAGTPIASVSGAITPPTYIYHTDPGASWLTFGEAAASSALGGLLILAGTRMLRNSPRSWTMHRIYIVGKIPLALVAAYAMWWVNMSYADPTHSNDPQFGPGTANYAAGVSLSIAVGTGLVSLIYPIALLFLLSSRQSKSFLSELRQYSNAQPADH